MLPVLLLALSQAPGPAEALLDCRGKPDAERLACADAVIARLGAEAPLEDAAPQAAQAETPPAPDAAEDAADEARSAEDAFGLPEPRETVDRIESAIAGITLSRRGFATVTLENGQVWRQISGDTERLTASRARRAEHAVIEPGAFGTYRMGIDQGRRVLRVERVR